MASSRIFPNPPVQLVVCEIRFPPRVSGQGVLQDLLKIFGDNSRAVFSGPGLRVQDPGTDPESLLFQVIDADSTLCATLWPSSLALEATSYVSFAEFKDQVLGSLRALVGASSLPTTRIGLRYVDEIHPFPVPEDVAGWGQWVDGRLLALPAITERPIGGFGGAFSTKFEDFYLLNFRFATSPGPAVQASGELKVRQRPATPAMVLDTDAYWEPPEGSEVNGQILDQILSKLHDHIGEIFYSVITDASVELFERPEEI